MVMKVRPSSSEGLIRETGPSGRLAISLAVVVWVKRPLSNVESISPKNRRHLVDTSSTAPFDPQMVKNTLKNTTLKKKLLS